MKINYALITEYLKRKENFLWLILIAVEYMLFRSYAVREAVNYAPIGYDQAVYIGNTYDIYGLLAQGDYGQAWTYINSFITSSALLSVVYALLFLFGYSRLSLLSINFIFLVLMQFVGYKVMRKVTSSSAAGVIFVGLTLMINTSFTAYGGLLDFRWDYIAFCLYTIWASLLLLWLHTKERKYMYLSAIVSGVLVFSRFWYALFVAGFAVFYFMFQFFKKRIPFKIMLRDIAVYGGICVAAGGWSIFVFLPNMVGYLISAGNSESNVLWNLDGGLAESFQHYIYWLFQEHLHIIFPVFLVLLLLLACIGTKQGFRTKSREYIKNTGYLLVVLLMPTAAFILQASQNTAVISVNLGVLVLIAVYLAAAGGHEKSPIGDAGRKQILAGMMALIAILVGIGNYVVHTTGQHGYQRDIDVAASDINKAIVQYMIENNMESASYFMDRATDVVYNYTMEIYAYENYDRKIEVKESMQVNMASAECTSEEVEQALKASDFIIVSRNGYEHAPHYPIDSALEPYRARINEYAEEEMLPIRTLEFLGGDVTVYARRSVSAAIGYADGWMGVEDTCIEFTKDSDRQDKLRLSGSCGYIDYDGLQLYVQELDKTAEVMIDPVYWTYEAEIDISELEIGTHELHLVFNDYFVPNQLDSSNSDKRRLVLLEPQNIFIQ